MTEPTDTNQASEDELRQKIYDVLNVHTPAGCAGRHCWGVEALEKLISDQVAKARIDELIGVRGWTEYEPDPKYSPAERFHVVPYTYLTKRIEELKRR